MDRVDAVDDNVQRLCHDFNNMSHRTNDHLKTDAALSNLRKITLDDINFIEKELDYYEKVSLIFLLYDDSEEALKLFYDENRNFLQNWIKNEIKNGKNWELKILEALCIIKNYYILRKLGYDKNELISRFLPNNLNTSLYVNNVKKALYIICESMNDANTKTFIHNLRQDFEKKFIPYQNFPEKYLELHFLYCFSIKYIKNNDLSNVIKILKGIDSTMSDILSSISNESNYIIEQDNVRENFNRNGRTDDVVHNFDSYAHDTMPVYHMDPQNAGICLIINQEHFNITKDTDMFLLPIKLADKPLERRRGTNVDKHRLKNTFEYFGFRVKTYDNLNHSDLINKIELTMTDFQSTDCCFIVCILSHGELNQVFGSDCVPVDISDIEDKIHDTKFKNLLNKPKILIIQSCQGDQLQEAVELSSITTDGPSNTKTTISKRIVIDVPKVTPERCDLLVCTSTISGYASIRNEVLGSWYIQELCKVLKEAAHKKHMYDLLTLVNNHVSQKVWHKDGKTICMVPCIRSSLRKSLFLKPSNQ